MQPPMYTPLYGSREQNNAVSKMFKVVRGKVVFYKRSFSQQFSP